VSTGEAAGRLGCSTRTVVRWIQDGRLRAITLPNGRYRVLTEDIDKILTPSVVGAAA
jgi:excisionase family DNA binding protein